MKYTTKNLTNYESDRLEEVHKWLTKKESWWSKGVNTMLKPLSSAMNVIVPPSVIEGALVGANKAAEFLTDKNDIIRDGGVSKISELKHKDLSLSDDLANSVENWALGFAAAEGAATGAVGVAGLAVDIPTLITWAIRTIRKTGLCYGFDGTGKTEEKFVFGVLQAASASNQSEKATSITVLQCLATMAAKTTWKKIAAKAAEDTAGKTLIEKFEQQLAKVLINAKELAPLIGKHLTKEAIEKGVPIVSAVVGAAANAKYIHDVATVAQYMYEQRWLIENGKLEIDITDLSDLKKL